MAQFKIRSMSTTDAGWGKYAAPIMPYHIYLRKPEFRTSAYWCQSPSETATFESVEAAQAEIDRSFPRVEKYEPLLDIVPVDDRSVPTFWDARKRKSDGMLARVVGTEIVQQART